jgi:N-acetylneuraminic acid mutarotase
MKRTLIFFLAVIALAQCRKAEVLEFPLIQTGEVSDISENGATFTAKIINLGALQVESYGFLWGLKANPDLESSNLSLFGNVEKGVFSANITNDLLSDTTYFVRAFITDGNTTTYGKTVSFRSRGSMVPVISDFHPKSGVENTVVVIKGDHFSGSLTGNMVHFGMYPAKVEKASKTELEVVLPGAINVTGYFDIQVETAKQLAKSTEKFLFEGCIISSFYPNEVRGNEEVKIFLEDCPTVGNDQHSTVVNIGGLNAQILEVNVDNILVKVNFNAQPGRHIISITTNGKITHSLDSILITSPWSKLSVTPALNRRNLSGFQIGNDIFVGLGTERSGSATELKKDFYRLNQEQNTWETIEDIPSPVRETSPSFVLNGKGYICLGINADQSMLNRYTYAYDPLTGSWSQRADFPIATRSHAVGFAIGNHGYAGLGYQKRDLWQYNPNADSWIIMDNYPNYNTDGVFAVAHGDKAYVGMGKALTYSHDLDIYTFNPNAIGNNWSLLTTFPGQSRYLATAFVIDNHLYVGLGVKGSTVFSDFWRYDITNDSWEGILNFPYTPRLKPQVFVVDGKALFVSGDAANMGEDETVVIYDPN